MAREAAANTSLAGGEGLGIRQATTSGRAARPPLPRHVARFGPCSTYPQRWLWSRLVARAVGGAIRMRRSCGGLHQNQPPPSPHPRCSLLERDGWALQ